MKLETLLPQLKFQAAIEDAVKQKFTKNKSINSNKHIVYYTFPKYGLYLWNINRRNSFNWLKKVKSKETYNLLNPKYY